jgi:hypothetical protein
MRAMRRRSGVASNVTWVPKRVMGAQLRISANVTGRFG